MMRKLARATFLLAMRSLFDLLGLFRRSKHILLACNGDLTAAYLRNIWSILRDDPQLRFFVLVRAIGGKPDEGDMIRAALPLTEVTRRWAQVRKWDLLIVADHAFKRLKGSGRCPVVYTQHGGCGKAIRGGDYGYYDRGVLDLNGRVFYTKMFEANECNKVRAIEGNPLLKDVIAVVGSPYDDLVLEEAKRRDGIRRELGYAPDDVVVFVLSSWGPECLFRTVGEGILKEIGTCKGEFKFILSAHPNEYRERPDGQRVWGEYLRTQACEGVVIREPDEPWVSYMVACDIIVTDHTSMAQYGAVLRRPIVYVPVPDSSVVKGTATWRLREISPVYGGLGDLRKVLCQARDSYPFDKLEEIALDLNSCPGQSAQRIREEVYSLLKLPIWSADCGIEGKA